MCGIIQYLSFCVCLISLSIRFLRFIHVIACARISFLYKTEYIASCGYIIYPHVHQWTLGCFYLLFILNSAAMNIGIQSF